MREAIVAIDAGNAVGIVIAEHDADTGEVEIIDFKQPVDCDLNEAVHHIRQAIRAAGQVSPDVHVIMERFDLRPENKFLADLSPVRINAVVEWLSVQESWRHPIVWQTPGQAKGLVPNAVLKNLGWYPTGKTIGYKDANDVRDAFRHLVHYLARTRGNRWVIERAWPDYTEGTEE